MCLIVDLCVFQESLWDLIWCISLLVSVQLVLGMMVKEYCNEYSVDIWGWEY